VVLLHPLLTPNQFLLVVWDDNLYLQRMARIPWLLMGHYYRQILLKVKVGPSQTVDSYNRSRYTVPKSGLSSLFGHQPWGGSQM